MGLKPLLVTFAPSIPTPLGKHNLDNIGTLGADHFVVHSNLALHKSLVLRGMELFGSPAIPMHLQIFHTSRALAEKFSIPSVFWGENCALEYGSTDRSLIRLPYSNLGSKTLVIRLTLILNFGQKTFFAIQPTLKL